MQVLRVKRGLEESARPGGFCKDCLTFIGAIRVLQHLGGAIGNRNSGGSGGGSSTTGTPSIDPRVFYSGKLRCDEYVELEHQLHQHYRGKADTEFLQLPHFLSSDAAAAQFMELVQQMCAANNVWDEIS